MSEANVEIVRRIYDALDRRDWDAVFRDAHPDLEFTTQRGLNSGTHRGREGVEGFLKDYIAAFERVAWEPEEFFEAGDHIVVLVITRGRPPGGSVDIETHNVHLWTIRDKTALSMRTFPEPEKALEAAGLPSE